MVDQPINVLLIQMIIGLFLFSYQLRLFERRVTQDFQDITTAMWNVMITMTTVGYGDFYPTSHMSRLIGVVVAFWGVFFVSLFVVALNSLLALDSAESKAILLLKRVKFKDSLKQESAGMLISSYRMKLINKNKKGLNQKDKLKALVDQKRNYKLHLLNFSKIWRQMRNLSDNDTAMENLRNNVDQLMEDIALIRMSQYFVYNDTRRLKKKIIGDKKNPGDSHWTDKV